jgi:cyclase
VVKTINFESYRPLGVATNFARVYNSRQVDELIVVDIDATLENRAPDLELIRDIAEECYMPLSVGGGIRTLDEVKQLIQSGADKVVINTSALTNPKLVTQIATSFGSQAIIVAIDVKSQSDGYHVCSGGGRIEHSMHPVEWAKRIEDLGAGEIYLNSIDKDGTMKGYDIHLTSVVAASINIPLIASGGAGCLDDFVEVIQQGGASAVACASVFHYTQITPLAIKQHLRERGINVRIE